MSKRKKRLLISAPCTPAARLKKESNFAEQGRGAERKPYWLVWVTIDRREEGPYYAGVTACEMTVDRSIRRGYKSLPEHVNLMDKSMKRKIIVEHMDESSKRVLADFLKNHDQGLWDRSSDELKKGLLQQ